jgi:hypothetical protein
MTDEKTAPNRDTDGGGTETWYVWPYSSSRISLRASRNILLMLSETVYIHNMYYYETSLSEESTGPIIVIHTCKYTTAKKEEVAACWKEEVQWSSWHERTLLPVVVHIVPRPPLPENSAEGQN